MYGQEFKCSTSSNENWHLTCDLDILFSLFKTAFGKFPHVEQGSSRWVEWIPADFCRLCVPPSMATGVQEALQTSASIHSTYGLPDMANQFKPGSLVKRTNWLKPKKQKLAKDKQRGEALWWHFDAPNYDENNNLLLSWIHNRSLNFFLNNCCRDRFVTG